LLATPRSFELTQCFQLEEFAKDFEMMREKAEGRGSWNQTAHARRLRAAAQCEVELFAAFSSSHFGR
jgi:hypothetical protein